MKRTDAQNKYLHDLLDELNVMTDKPAYVLAFTNDRTEHSSEMTIDECAKLITHLWSRLEEGKKKMQRKIIALLCLLGYVNEKGQPDTPRINNYIKQIGSNNPRKVALFGLTYKELPKVVTQVEKMYEKETKRGKGGGA